MRRPASAFRRAGVYEGAASTVPETGEDWREWPGMRKSSVRGVRRPGTGCGLLLSWKDLRSHPLRALLSASLNHFESTGAPSPCPRASRGRMYLAMVGHESCKFLFCLV